MLYMASLGCKLVIKAIFYSLSVMTAINNLFRFFNFHSYPICYKHLQKAQPYVIKVHNFIFLFLKQNI